MRDDEDMRLLATLLLAAGLLSAQQIRLYLKDGGFHMVREFEVVEDRVRYYSTERRDWEEIPTELVDLERTRAETTDKTRREREQAAMADAEDEFERAERREVARIPQEPGVYMVVNGEVRTLKQAELSIVNNKKRSVLKILTPVPVVAGKASVEMAGEQSAFIVEDPRPFFYFRLMHAERFTMVKVKVKKGLRELEIWNTVPVTREIFADREEVDIFRQQFQDGLFKIWPVQPLEPGEYAVIEYTEGEGNTQAWDFRVAARP
jgi:TPP-dependent indolepyruvate ferredoxin oxidoreductase alpha subunit